MQVRHLYKYVEKKMICTYICFNNKYGYRLEILEAVYLFVYALNWLALYQHYEIFWL